MHFPERDSFKKFSSKSDKKISSVSATNGNIHFCILGPLVLKQVGLQYPKSLATLIQCKGSLFSKFRRICQSQFKLLHGNHSVYRCITTAP